MIEIDVEQRDILNQALQELIRPLAPDSASRQNYQRLAAAVASGSVAEELIPALERALEVTLSTGRIRHLYGPQPEQQLVRLYNRTPAGARLHEHTKRANHSLQALKDQKIEGLSFSPKTPGAYRLMIQTDQCEITVSIDRNGVSVDQLAIDL